MSMWGSSITRQQLLQSISLFRLLDEVPELPREYAPQQDNASSLYCLGAAREKEISTNLAFLSAITYSKVHVMAVCIEEHSNRRECTIRLSSNTGERGTLPDVVHGFKVIAILLEQAAQREKSKNEDEVALFNGIIHIDLRRILTRLRSKHASSSNKTRGKTPLLSQLSQLLQNDLLDSTSRDFIEVLLSLFKQLETISDINVGRTKAERVVREIVMKAHEFTLTVDLTTVVGTSSLEPPSLKKYIPDAIKKLGRYYSIACELVRAARDGKCRVFQKVHVVAYQIQVPAWIESQIQASRSSLELSHIISTEPVHRQDRLKQDLLKRISEIAGRHMVHAEVQLLFYYQIHQETLQPRFIASSKKACYLCDLFFRVHGRFQVPRTHGRLYDKWILPDWIDIPAEQQQELAGVVGQFKTALDNRLKKIFISGSKKYEHPNESFLPPEALRSRSDHSSSAIANGFTSTSTLRAGSSLIHKKDKGRATYVGREMPSVSPQDVRIPSEHTEYLVTSSTAKPQNVDIDELKTATRVSYITVSESNLPYSQIITLKSPSLLVQIGKATITFEFLEVLSGLLSIGLPTKVEEGRYERQIIDIKDIPVNSEIRVACLHTYKKLEMQLQDGDKGIIDISFSWR